MKPRPARAQHCGSGRALRRPRRTGVEPRASGAGRAATVRRSCRGQRRRPAAGGKAAAGPGVAPSARTGPARAAPAARVPGQGGPGGAAAAAGRAGEAAQGAGRPPGPLSRPALAVRGSHPRLRPQRPPPPSAAHLAGRRCRRRRRARSRETSRRSALPRPPAARADPGLQPARRAPLEADPRVGVAPLRARDPASPARRPLRPPPRPRRVASQVQGGRLPRTWPAGARAQAGSLDLDLRTFAEALLALAITVIPAAGLAVRTVCRVLLQFPLGPRNSPKKWELPSSSI